jgi:hypothetical protein
MAYVGIVVIGGVFTGCAATQTAIEHHSLETTTKLSETVFLSPVPHSQKTIFLQVKNTSGQKISLQEPLQKALQFSGYQVLQDPQNAHYLLQANILTLTKMDEAASKLALGGGYGSALAGSAVGAALGSMSGMGRNGVIGGAAAGGLLSLAADSLVKNVNYTMITDVQISERIGRDVRVREEQRSKLKNGSASVTQQVSIRDSGYQHYRTRIVSNANQVNLSFEKARPVLEKGLVTTLSGIF